MDSPRTDPRNLPGRLFTIDSRALAAFRIGLALLIGWDVVDRCRFLEALWGPQGMYPRAHQAPWHSMVVLSPYSWNDSLGYQAGLLLLTAGAALALLLGWRTRWAALVSWLLVLSLHLRGPTMLDIGDHVLGYLLLWGTLLPLGLRWSIDARGLGAGPVAVRSLATAGVLLQVALSYFAAGLAKLGSEPWMTGRAVALALAGDTWVTPFGSWLYRHPGLTVALTWGSLAVETTVPLLLFSPWRTAACRGVAVLVLLAFDAGLGLSIRLGLIPFVMALGLVLFLPAAFWDRLAGSAGAPAVPAPRLGRIGAAVALFLLVGMVGASAYHLLTERPLPAPAALVLRAIRWDQRWTMYAPPYQDNFRLSFRGVTREGRVREIAIGAHRADWPPAEAWPPTERLWRNYRARLYVYDMAGYGDSRADVNGVVEWFAREWNRTHAPQDHWLWLQYVKESRRPWTPGERRAGTSGVQPLVRAAPLITLRLPEQ
jgi:hypothetical protein